MRHFPWRSRRCIVCPINVWRNSSIEIPGTKSVSKIVTWAKLYPANQGKSSFLIVSISGSSDISQVSVAAWKVYSSWIMSLNKRTSGNPGSKSGDLWEELRTSIHRPFCKLIIAHLVSDCLVRNRCSLQAHLVLEEALACRFNLKQI